MIGKYFLVLGRACNMSCSYCMQGRQHEIIIEKLPPVNEVVKMFPQEGKYTIIFYGGEPLLYWNFIKEFILLMRVRNSQVSFGLPTNGLLLTRDKVDFMNSVDMAVALSHDGKYQEENRFTEDILKTSPEPYLALKHKNISAVVTRKHFDFYDVWEYTEDFRKKHKLEKRDNVYIQVVKDVEGNTAKDLLINDMPEFELMLDKVFKNLYTSIMQEDYTSYEFMQYQPMITTLGYRIKNPQEQIGVWCGADSKVCHLDVYGNLYLCHNSADPFGNVSAGGIRVGYNPYRYDIKCRQCEAYIICGGGCPVASPENREAMCYVMKNQIVRLIRTLIKVKEDMRWKV